MPDVSVIDDDIHISNRDGLLFYADFSINIDGEPYIIQLIGTNESLKNTGKIGARNNPLLEGGTTNLRGVISLDIPKNTQWKLIKVATNTEFMTNEIFWEYFRKRIPSTHPLSKI